jgi:murein L,D-transpeptidase YafK
MKQIVVKKEARSLELFEDGTLLKSYRVVLGSCPVGTKAIEGDGKTPEGEYYIRVKNDKSKFHLSLGLNYPSKDDAARGLRSGLIDDGILTAIENASAAAALPPQKTPLGGEIYIHGGGTEGDWTKGCIALEKRDMEELFELVSKDTKVRILP